MKVVFFNIGWMNRYAGLSSGDTIQGGGTFIKEMGYGQEIFNFKPHKGQLFGYVQPPGGKAKFNVRKIDITKIGAARSDGRIENMTVFWTAKSPLLKRTVIVGWYRNATVFRHWQPPPADSGRTYKKDELGYYCQAAAADGTLLDIDSRIMEVPRQSGKGDKGKMGQANIWYAHSEIGKEFAQRALSFMETGIVPPDVAEEHRRATPPCQVDPVKRAAVEEEAVRIVTDHYARQGYLVESVERENLGWDLNVRLRNIVLKVEVKGLSGSQLSIELSPNEYEKMQQYRDVYRLAVVTDTLTDPELTIFSFNDETNHWEDRKGRRAIVTPKQTVSAIVQW
jgi:hypothetical protein